MSNSPANGPVLRVLRLLKTEKNTVIFLFGLILLASAFDIAVPFISQKLIDTLINFFTYKTATPVKILILSAAGILMATVLNRIIKSFYNYRLFKNSTKMEDKVRHEAFDKYLRLHTLFHHSSSGGQIIGRIERGASAVYIIINDIFGQNLLPPLVIFTGVVIALFIKNSWIALAVLLPLPIYILAVRNISSKIYNIEKQSNEEFEALAKEAYDVAGNVHTVKRFFQEDVEIKKHTELLSQARVTQYEAEKLWAMVENTQTFIATLGRIAVIILGGFFVIKGLNTVGEFVLYVTLQNMAYQPLAQLSVVLPRLRRNISRVERLFGILDEPILVTDKKGAMALPIFQRQVEFKNVGFKFGSKNNWAIKNCSVIIPAGTTVALVGRSGSGKTTFANLLLRSFDPQEGSIAVDGNNLCDVTQESLRGQIGVVPQEVDLFSRTLAENIAYGKPDIGQNKIEAAARMALAHDFIMKLEQGYQAQVGERGIKLSGGERQRIGIARLILKDPQILIFDEATSHLDTESEKLIQQATQALIKNRTSIIIAHRLSTVINADMILVFNRGEIEARGTHAELLETSPTYRKLYSLQFSREMDLTVDSLPPKSQILPVSARA